MINAVIQNNSFSYFYIYLTENISKYLAVSGKWRFLVTRHSTLLFFERKANTRNSNLTGSNLKTAINTIDVSDTCQTPLSFAHCQKADRGPRVT